MAVINTGLTLKGARSEFFDRFRNTEKHWQTLATTIKSNHPSESYRWLGSLPTLREWGSGRLAQGLRSESYDVDNLKYEATIEVDRDELDDDVTGQIRIRVNELAAAAAMHPTSLIEQLLINGGTAGFNSYDGVTFFNNTHVSGASGSQDNDIGASAVVPTNPTVAEWKEAFKTAIQTMMAFKNDVGEPFRASPSGLVAVVPPSMFFTAMEALNATLLNSSNNILQGAAQVIPLPGLTSDATWYLCKTDGVIRPFVFQDRMPIEFNQAGSGSEEEFIRERHLYGVRARYRVTYGYWQYAIRVTFA